MTLLTDALQRLQRCSTKCNGSLRAELIDIAEVLRFECDKWASETERLNTAQANAIVNSAETIAELEESEARLKQARNEAEAACRKAERLVSFGDILERSLNEIYIFDAQSLHFVLVNRGARENLGYSMDELRQMTPLDLKTEFTAQTFAALVEPLRNGSVSSVQVASTHTRKDQSVYDIDIHLQADRYDDRSVFVAIIQDITLRKQAEEERALLQKQLVNASRAAGMAEVASGVLHNVGNVLNSVNVSTSMLMERARESRITRLTQAAELLSQHEDDLPSFLTLDSQGRHFVPFLRQLAENQSEERDQQVDELQSLLDNVEHIKQIISTQQEFASAGGTEESVDVAILLQDALKMNDACLVHHSIRIACECDDVPPIVTDRHKLLQILVNLINNAEHATENSCQEDKTITLAAFVDAAGLCIRVSDNGIGINPEHLSKIFSHGFTTKKTGHGFGLHSSGLAARQLNGSLAVHSDGLDQGATFTLRLPLRKAAMCT